MKRMQLIAAALCLVMLTTVGAGAAAAKQPTSDNVKQFDVALYQDQGTATPVGTLSVNTNAWTYTLNARGLEPNTDYWLKCLDASGVLTTVTSTAGGTVHMQGKLDAVPSELIAPGALYVLGSGTPPLETSPILYVDAKYASGVFEYDVYGRVVLITFDSAGHALPQIPVENALVWAEYQGKYNRPIFGKSTYTNEKGNFDIWDTKFGIDQKTFSVEAYYTYNGVRYGASDNNVEWTG